MNIFYLSSIPNVAARLHCDQHVVKMILETAQLLSTAHRQAGSTDERLYKATHANHPSAVWVRTNSANYEWAYDLFTSLLSVYTARYGRVHSSARLVDVLACLPAGIKKSDFISEPAQAMPDKYRVNGDAILAYRRYYANVKTQMSRFAYNRSKSPDDWPIDWSQYADV